jgi:hypothetical protein
VTRCAHKLDPNYQLTISQRIVDVRRVAGKRVQIFSLDAPSAIFVLGNIECVEGG